MPHNLAKGMDTGGGGDTEESFADVINDVETFDSRIKFKYHERLIFEDLREEPEDQLG